MIVTDARVTLSLIAQCAGSLTDPSSATLQQIVKSGKLVPVTEGYSLGAWEATVKVNAANGAAIDLPSCTVTTDDDPVQVLNARDGEDWEGQPIVFDRIRALIVVLEPEDADGIAETVNVQFDAQPGAVLPANGGCLVLFGGSALLSADLITIEFLGSGAPDWTVVRILVIGETAPA